MNEQNNVFYHQRLDAYRVALQFAQWQKRAHVSGPLKLQLERAAESVVLNNAERRLPNLQQMIYQGPIWQDFALISAIFRADDLPGPDLAGFRPDLCHFSGR